MSNFELLSFENHKNIKVVTDYSALYGDNISYCPVFPFEFRELQKNYAIVFHKNTQTGVVSPVVLLGFDSNENLFLSEGGWGAGYIPAMIRKGPLLIGFQDSGNGKERTRVVTIDKDHPRLNTNDGEALFEPLGGRTEYLEETANLLEAIHHGQVHCNEFVKRLEEYGLLESVTMDITLEDGSSNQMLGFYVLNEERVQGLTGAELESLSQSGFLQPMFMMLASTVNMRDLIKRKNNKHFEIERGHAF